MRLRRWLHVLGCAVLCLPAFCLAAFHVRADDSDIQELLEEAKQGNLKAELDLADAYIRGEGLPKDDGKALLWYLKAAEQGSIPAMIEAGSFYEQGKGVKKDSEQALRWYQEAAELLDKTNQQNHANGYILRLSQSGAIKEKYGGIPTQGSLLLVKLDDTTRLDTLIQNLKTHTREIETGKAYWIGYNVQMILVAGRGDRAIPPLVDLVKNTTDPAVRRAGLLTLHLIGIGGRVVGRWNEEFKDRAAREALWKLMAVEGLTDDVMQLLKRDPWPADVPAIINALARVKGSCPLTLNALARYPLPSNKRPFNTLGASGLGGTTIQFTIPEEYTDRDYVSVAVGGIKAALPNEVDVEEGVLDQIPIRGTYGSPESKAWLGSLDDLLKSIEDINPPFDYVSPGRSVYYFTQNKIGDGSVILHFCTAATAKKRLLAWWHDTGRRWYCF